MEKARDDANATVEHEGEDYTCREDIDENRGMFIFPGKSDEQTRALLKRHAFKCVAFTRRMGSPVDH